MKTKKKIWCCLFSLLWIFVLIFPVMASDIPEIPTERQKPLLVDEAGLLSEEESSTLINKLEEISQRQENEVAVVTVNSLGVKQPRHMQMITMIIMVMVMEKMMMVFCFW